MNGIGGKFPYPTVKTARIKDSRLGLARYAFMVLIFVYVVGYQIMWRGNHLEMHDLTGVYQLNFDHPTMKSCDSTNVECGQNFTSLSKLSYCSQAPESAPIKLPCQYWDAHQLGQLTDQGLMIPSHILTFYQQNGCKPSAANNWTCNGWLYDFLDNKGHVQPKRRQASPASEIFVADVERFTLTIDHSVRSTLGHRYYPSEMVGYILDCEHENKSDNACIPRPIPCGHKSCMPPTLVQNRAAIEDHQEFRGDRRSLTLLGLGDGAHTVERKRQSRSFSKTALEPDIEDAEPDNVAVLQLQGGEELLRKTQSAAAQPGSTPAAPAPADDKAGEGEDDQEDKWGEVAAPGRAIDIESLGAVSIPEGDLFSIGQLLKAANVSLDKRRHNVASWIGGTYRSSGFVLVIRIHYSNVESWLGTKVLPWNPAGPSLHYTYRITQHASHDDYMLSKVHDGGSSLPKNTRILSEFHGIRVLVEQTGSVATWDNIQLLLILTTTLALSAVATFITDTLALNCMPQSEEYSAIKFEAPKKSEAKAGDDAEEQDEGSMRAV